MRPGFLEGILRVFLFFSLILGLFGFLGWLFPPDPARHNARRMSCQSNLKQIGLALQQYAQDYDDRLPPNHWMVPVVAYTKTDLLFQCAETKATKGTIDYFFNARFSGKPLEKIASPNTLILVGDGQDDAADATLSSIPMEWRTDKNSPVWRHLDTANYLFADGHVKGLRVNRVDRNFRMVNR